MKNTIMLGREEYPRDPDHDYEGDDETEGVESTVEFVVTPQMAAKDDFYNTPCSGLVFLRKKAEETLRLCDFHEVPKEP